MNGVVLARAREEKERKYATIVRNSEDKEKYTCARHATNP